MGEAYARDKRLIRQTMEARRRELSRDDVARWSAAACDRVVRLPVFAAALHVVLYAAIDNELDTAMIAEMGRAAGKLVYYPEVRGGVPGFVRDSGPPVALGVAEAALVLVPGVAFDARGARLGRGRGWYDRALARFPAAARLGLAYDFQVVPAVPEAPWDVRMHALVTESRLIGEPPDAARAQKED